MQAPASSVVSAFFSRLGRARGRLSSAQGPSSSGGRVRLAAGTLYGALKTRVERGWSAALGGDQDSRKKEYVRTPAGREILEGELQRLEELVENGRHILGGTGA